MPIAACPDPIPHEMDDLLERLAHLWRDAPSRPRVEASVSSAWSAVLRDWLASSDLPLLVRQIPQGASRGEALKHLSGRTVVPADNTPANWVLSQALNGQCTTLDELSRRFERGAMPVAMMFKKGEAERAWQRGTRDGVMLNGLGWKVCHIEPVGLGRGDLLQRPVAELHAHVLRFLSPLNMFVVPKALGGMGELPHFVRAMAGSN